MTASIRPAGSFVDRVYGSMKRVPVWALALIWLLPSFGLFVNSFRPRDSQRNSGWWTLEPNGLGVRFTTDNYRQVFEAGTTNSIGDSLLNSAAITIPATIIPIAIASFAAYGFAWIDFRGRKALFIAVVSMMAIPLQVALIPLLAMYYRGAHLSIPFLDKTLTLSLIHI